MLGCDDVDVTAARVTISGTWTFRSDMTYTRSLTVQTTLEFNAPLSCDCSVSDCASLDPGSYHSTCTGTGCCSCTQPQPQQTLNETGTYAVNGSSVKLTASGGNPLDWQYCVTGNMLSLTYASTLSNTTFSAHR